MSLCLCMSKALIFFILFCMLLRVFMIVVVVERKGKLVQC
jgi:hypothetical protein